MRRLILVGIVVIGLSAMAGLGRGPMAWAEPTTQKSENLKLEDCPQPVQDTLKREVGSGRIQELKKEKKDDKTVYRADAHIDGKNYDIVVAEDGKLLDMTQE